MFLKSLASPKPVFYKKGIISQIIFKFTQLTPMIFKYTPLTSYLVYAQGLCLCPLNKI